MAEKTIDEQIDDIVKLYAGWRGDLVTKIRAAIKAADPEVIEEVKWKMPTRPTGWPVWSHNGMLCIVEVWKNDVKLIFFKGAQMVSLRKHFNARLNGKTDRAIEYHEDDSVDKAVIKTLILEAERLNDLKAK
jgi:hypothetical protein